MPKVWQPKREDGFSPLMENMRSGLGDGRRNCRGAWQFSKLRPRMVEMALPLALKILEKMGRISTCVSYPDLKTMVHRLPKCLLLLMSTGSRGWSGHVCPQIWENRILGTPIFFPGGKENLDWDILLVEMRLSKTFDNHRKLLTVYQLFFEGKNHPCNHFLELSWFFKQFKL